VARARTFDLTPSLRLLTVLLVSVGALAGCSPARSSPSSSGSAVIELPTQLPDDISYGQAMALFAYDHSRPFDVQERSSRSNPAPSSTTSAISGPQASAARHTS
jgi:hypothetical protein